MSRISVLCSGGTRRDVNEVGIECPFCHSMVVPNYIFMDEGNMFSFCPNSVCNRHFVLSKNEYGDYTKVQPNSIPGVKKFSEIIQLLSPSFVLIYNQAYHAEQINLDQICGVGYRKALEFLIKDYLLSLTEDEERKNNIKNKFLNNCIQEDVTNENIKNVAKLAVWLGNDETHYVRKWAEKDVTNLKQLIDLTLRWIENEIETKRVLEDMK